MRYWKSRAGKRLISGMQRSRFCIFEKDFFIQNLSTGQFCKEYFIELLFCIIAEAVPECRNEADVSVGTDHERAYG